MKGRGWMEETVEMHAAGTELLGCGGVGEYSERGREDGQHHGITAKSKGH